MKILVLILFLSLVGAVVGVDGLVFCLSVLLVMPVFYFLAGHFFANAFLAYSVIFLIILASTSIFTYSNLSNNNRFESQKIFDRMYHSLAFTIFFIFFYFLSCRWPEFYSLGERMRDLALIGAGVRDPIFIQEPWMSGVGLNYYAYWYRFGHQFSVLLGLKHWEVYPLLVSFAPAFLAISFVLLSSEIFTLSKKTSFVLSSLLVLMSNPAGVVYFFLGNVTWWYPSRVIVGTIHEFPAWSFLLGDAHPHYLNSGTLLWMLYLAFMFFKHNRANFFAISSVLIIPTLFLQNANMWEVPVWLGICLATFGVTVLARVLSGSKKVETSVEKTDRKYVFGLFLLVVFGVCLYLMKANFTPIDSKVAYVVGEVKGSKPEQFLLHWGFFLVVIILGELLEFSRYYRILFLVLFIGLLFLDNILPFLLLLWLINLLRLIKSIKLKSEFKFEQIFCESLVLSALTLLIVPEVIFLDDPYGGDIERMNTFFKISYVNWSLMFFASLYLLKDFYDKLADWKYYTFLPISIIACSFFFSVLPLRPAAPTRNIRGLDLVEMRYPGVKPLVEFLETQIDGIVLEAQGPPYSETAMVATLTNLPAYLGWINHLDLLMPTKRDEIHRRENISDVIYKTNDCSEKSKLLSQEDISYFVVGALEKKSYPEIDKLDYSCMKLIFQNQNYRLFTNF